MRRDRGLIRSGSVLQRGRVTLPIGWHCQPEVHSLCIFCWALPTEQDPLRRGWYTTGEGVPWDRGIRLRPRFLYWLGSMSDPEVAPVPVVEGVSGASWVCHVRCVTR